MSSSLATASSRASSRRAVPDSRRGVPAGSSRPTLQVVQAPVVHRGHAVVAVLALMLLGAGLLTLLLINTGLAQGSFKLDALQKRSDALSDRQQALAEDIEAQAAPQQLASRARSMGMVPSESEAFIRLSDGKVFGVAVPAKAPARLTVIAPKTTSTKTTSTKSKDAKTKDAKTKEVKNGPTKGDTNGTTTKKSDRKAR